MQKILAKELGIGNICLSIRFLRILTAHEFDMGNVGYNNHWYHESIYNLPLDELYFVSKRDLLVVREMIKRETNKLRGAYMLGQGGLKKEFKLIKYHHYLY